MEVKDFQSDHFEFVASSDENGFNLAGGVSSSYSRESPDQLTQVPSFESFKIC